MANEDAGPLFDDFHPDVQDRLAKDMRWTIRVNDRGRHDVDWNMSKGNEALLREYAEIRGVTFDELLRDLSKRVLQRALDEIEMKARRN